VETLPAPPAHVAQPKWKIVCYAQQTQSQPAFYSILLAMSPFILIFALILILGRSTEEETNPRIRWHPEYKHHLEPLVESDDEK
jgi:hypothetical protein